MAHRSKFNVFGSLLLLAGTALIVKTVIEIMLERRHELMPAFLGLALFAAIALVLKIKRWTRSSSPLTAAEKSAQLRSWKWQRMRYEVLRKYGRKCMLCGATEGAMHVDHIRPRSKYPELVYDPNNLQVLCAPCNLGKSNAFEDDFREARSK